MLCASRADLSGREVLVDQGSGRGVNPLRPLCQLPMVVPMFPLLRKCPHMRLSSAVRLQHERERELPSQRGSRKSSRLRRKVPMDVGGHLDAPVKPHYPMTLLTSASRGVSLANLVLSTKTATARAASVVSRPTVMFLVNPSTT